MSTERTWKDTERRWTRRTGPLTDAGFKKKTKKNRPLFLRWNCRRTSEWRSVTSHHLRVVSLQCFTLIHRRKPLPKKKNHFTSECKQPGGRLLLWSRCWWNGYNGDICPAPTWPPLWLILMCLFTLNSITTPVVFLFCFSLHLISQWRFGSVHSDTHSDAEQLHWSRRD